MSQHMQKTTTTTTYSQYIHVYLIFFNN